MDGYPVWRIPGMGSTVVARRGRMPLPEMLNQHGGLDMRNKWFRIGGVVAVTAAIVAPTLAVGSGPVAKGRMTGGGKVVGKAYTYKNGVKTSHNVYVTHGFTLGCDIPDRPQRLQINWSGGNKWHMEELEATECHDSPQRDEGMPRAGFDLFKGWGEGRLNGDSGAEIEFKFTDRGEPGEDDEIRIRIWDTDGNLVLKVDGPIAYGAEMATLELGGNHQAHRETGNDIG